MALLTLFVVLPSDEVFTLRNVQSGNTLSDIRSRLEICSGLPSQVYNFISRNGQILQEDLILELGLNVWDGFLLRAELKESWKPLIEAVRAGDLDLLLRDRQPGMHTVLKLPGDKKEFVKMDEERECVALYMACWTGSVKICHGLLNAGVNPNSVTPHHRTPIFAAAVRDNHIVMDILLKHGAMLSVKDCNGDTPLDIARRNFARQCINRIRRAMKEQLRTGSNTSIGQFTTTLSQTSGILSLSSNNTATNCIHRSRPFTAKEKPNNKNVKETRCKSDSSFNKRFVSFKEREQELHRTKVITLPTESDSCPTYEFTYLPRSLTNNSLEESTDNQQPEKRPQTMTNDTVVNVGVPITNSSKEKRFTKVQGVTINHNLQTNSDFLRVKSALIEYRHQNQLIHSDKASVHYCNTDGEAVDTPTISPDTEDPAQNPTGDVQNNASTNAGDEKDNMAKLDASIGGTESTLKGESITGAGHDGSVRNDNAARPGGTEPTLKGESITGAGHDGSVRNDNAARPVTTNRSMFRNKKHKRKRAESLRTALRQIQLAERQKRASSANGKVRQTFEQWLRMKQEQEDQRSSEDDNSDNSSPDSVTNKHHSLLFPVWLKQVRDRPKYQQNSANSLNYGKTRAKQGLVEIQNPNSDQPLKTADMQSYMHAYKEWREIDKKLPKNKITSDAKEAKRLLAEQRQQMLASAITFNEWMSNCEERKYLTKVISQSQGKKLCEIEKSEQGKRISSEIRNQKWGEGLDKFEKLHRVHSRPGQEIILEKSGKVVSFYDEIQSTHDFGGSRQDNHSSNTSLNKTRTNT